MQWTDPWLVRSTRLQIWESPWQGVMKYWSVRGKFDGVHPDLQNIGVQRIEVTKDSLVFVGDNAGTNNHQNRDPNEDEDPNEVTSNDPNLEQDEDEEKTCWAWICWNCHNFCWK